MPSIWTRHSVSAKEGSSDDCSMYRSSKPLEPLRTQRAVLVGAMMTEMLKDAKQRRGVKRANIEVLDSISSITKPSLTLKENTES
jgi:hypothetical protein